MKIKTYVLSILFSMMATAAFAGAKAGISVTGMMFDSAKGTEISKFNGNDTTPIESKTQEVGAAFGSVFVEYSIDMLNGLSVGLDYQISTMEGDTVTNTRTTDSGAALNENKFSVDVENHLTAYMLYPLGGEGAFIKLGASQADVNVNENIASSTSYSDETLYGGHVSLGFEKDLDAFFVRGEAGYSEYGTVTSKSSSKNTTVKAQLNDGVHARISIGKSF